ncbi:LysR family transcriptional regulator [Novosphingobium nitrogenifigens DSM 19370]|uniref:LysR family transcriptional regulator n=2 Tax=Novosphingobium nitrogenifigens TaxID=378548 RepID=F1Z4H3_9SPHN|nr:LysR family transcriptional regulator [Novosphingobium nitrogenifigens]EGD60583.1 LysR family transcriptional regulator [Novosphingobium nitrogenifigens DSM 19370]
MQAPDWNDYQAFLAVARSGQLARAGASLGCDATTIGRRLRRLETRLGATLFEQTREGQILTEAGEALLAEVEAMAQAASRIAEQASGGGGPAGHLRVSLTEGFATALVAPAFKSFVEAFPRLTIDLVASSGLLSPSKREADLAVTLSRPRAGPVIAGKLSDYTLGLYATRGYLAQMGTPAAPADLAVGHRLIGYVPDLLYAPELRYLSEFEPGLVAALRSPSIIAQARMVAAGSGIGVLPCFMGDADKMLVPVLPERRITRTFWLVTHKDTHNLARVRAFKSWLTGLITRQRAILLPR